MSVEKAKEFLLALKENGAGEAWAKKAAEAKSEEEKDTLAADIAREMGFDLTAEDVREALAGLKKEVGLEALDDDAVEGVAGGGAPVDFRHLKCPNARRKLSRVIRDNQEAHIYSSRNICMNARSAERSSGIDLRGGGHYPQAAFLCHASSTHDISPRWGKNLIRRVLLCIASLCRNPLIALRAICSAQRNID